MLAQNPRIDRVDQLSLGDRINEYERRFAAIETKAKNLSAAFQSVGRTNWAQQQVFSLVEATFLERPAQSADFLAKLFLLPRRHPLVIGLHELDGDITALRKTGEDILVLSKDLDKAAREKTEP